jgi:hypothetical protein
MRYAIKYLQRSVYLEISTPFVAPRGQISFGHGTGKLSRLTKSFLDITINGNLSSSKTTNHKQTSRKTSEGTTKTKFASNLDETRNSALAG